MLLKARLKILITVCGDEFGVDSGIQKAIQKGKGELILNATDIFNTMIIKKEINGTTFTLQSTDCYETQVIRVVYSYKF